MLEDDFDPYDLLVLNTQHIERLARTINQQQALIESLTGQITECVSMLVSINTRVNQLDHRITRLERQNAIE